MSVRIVFKYYFRVKIKLHILSRTVTVKSNGEFCVSDSDVYSSSEFYPSSALGVSICKPLIVSYNS